MVYGGWDREERIMRARVEGTQISDVVFETRPRLLPMYLTISAAGYGFGQITKPPPAMLGLVASVPGAILQLPPITPANALIPMDGTRIVVYNIGLSNSIVLQAYGAEPLLGTATVPFGTSVILTAINGVWRSQ